MKVLHPPYGYDFVDFTHSKGVPIDDEEAILGVCLALSNDLKFQMTVLNDTHKGRLKNLRANGFRIINGKGVK